MPPKKKSPAVDPEVIGDILARLAKLEKWRAKWKEHRQQKKEEKAKKRKLQENEEPAKKRAKANKSKTPTSSSIKAPPPEAKGASKHPTAAKSRPKAKAKSLAALLPPCNDDPSQESREQSAPPPAAKQEAGNAAGPGGSKTEPLDVANKVIPADPRAAHCCYDMLKIDREATLEQVKRAYRSLAISMHPDKGGNHKAFCSLQAAFDVLQDEAERKAYDRELRTSQSRDGQVGNGLTDSGPVVQPTATSPVMLRDALMGAAPKHWPYLLDKLTDENLKTLQNFLGLTQQEQRLLAEEFRGKLPPQHSRQGVPGICRHGNTYMAKISMSGISVTSKLASLTEAIDAGIALKEIRNIVKRHPDDLEGGLRAAVQERRVIDQDTIFFMRFRYDFRHDKTIRHMTPDTSDIEEVLKDRRTFQRLVQQGASKAQFEEAHLAMKQRTHEAKAAHSPAKLGQQLVTEVAREVLQRMGTTARRVLSLKDAKDEAASDPESSDSDSSSSSSS